MQETKKFRRKNANRSSIEKFESQRPIRVVILLTVLSYRDNREDVVEQRAIVKKKKKIICLRRYSCVIVISFQHISTYIFTSVVRIMIMTSRRVRFFLFSHTFTIVKFASREKTRCPIFRPKNQKKKNRLCSRTKHFVLRFRGINNRR